METACSSVWRSRWKGIAKLVTNFSHSCIHNPFAMWFCYSTSPPLKVGLTVWYAFAKRRIAYLTQAEVWCRDLKSTHLGLPFADVWTLWLPYEKAWADLLENERACAGEPSHLPRVNLPPKPTSFSLPDKQWRLS